MRLSFPNAEHPDVLAGDGTVRIGSAASNDIVLAGLGAEHARLTRDVRGIVLEIAEAGARAHVNARPVREKAFVRYGDTVCLGSVTLVVSAVDPSELSLIERPQPVQGPQRGVVRGMSGGWFGKSVAIIDGLIISVGKDGAALFGESAESTPCVRFSVGEGGIGLESKEATGSWLNGRRVVSTALRTGDQLTIGRDRFVMECSSAKPVEEAVVTTDHDSAAADAAANDPRRSIGAIWWLLGAAALIALVLVAVLLRGV